MANWFPVLSFIAFREADELANHQRLGSYSRTHPRGVISALPAFWIGVGYPIQGDSWRGSSIVANSESHKFSSTTFLRCAASPADERRAERTAHRTKESKKRASDTRVSEESESECESDLDSFSDESNESNDEDFT
ncbi:hypothetical protein EVAR_10383_1 [Eumeta japonica]|uniref:Uncharacterized protein n=1 Tax=Eumeta variegata TaxID=151549 RepID=A0A4C1UCS3_EUMVA|nr:hypothetical protein EVAR_10383_1 [Eumeta japonica]